MKPGEPLTRNLLATALLTDLERQLAATSEPDRYLQWIDVGELADAIQRLQG